MAPAFPLRIRQVIAHGRPGTVSPTLPAHLSHRLAPAAQATFAQLSVADQQHLIAVATRVSEMAGDDEDLINAALLHDIGKADGDVRIRLTDRVAKVLLERSCRSLLQRLSRQATAPRFCGGVWVLSRHAATGASWARGWGYSDRVAWLIAHHEDRNPEDASLALLIDIDSGHGGRRIRA